MQNIRIKKEVFEKLYNKYTNRELCKKLNITEPTLQRHLKQANIKKKGSGRRKNLTLY
jgi:DNA-binding CsgD family transcriptional regulator